MGHVFRVKYQWFGVIVSEVLTLEHQTNNSNVNNVGFKAYANTNKTNNANKTKQANLGHCLAQQLGIKPAQIIKINKEYGKPRCEIKTQDLSSVLISLYCASLNAQNLIDALTQTLKDFYNNPALNNQLFVFKKQSLSISQALRRLQVDPVVVALIEAGVSTGRLSLALDKAQDYLALIEEVKKNSHAGFAPSMLKLVFGVGLSFIAPIFLADFFNTILIQINKTPGFIIQSFNFIKDHNHDFLIMALIVVVLVIYLFKFKKPQISNLPLFSVFIEIEGLKKSLAFIPFYSTLNQSGFSDKDIITQYQQIDNLVATQLLCGMNTGLSMVEAIKASSIDAQTAKYLASALTVDNAAMREKSFLGVLKRLGARLNRQSRKLSVIFNVIATLMILIGISMLIGAYFVISTIAF